MLLRRLSDAVIKVEN